MKEYKIKIQETEYPIQLKMLAVKEYEKITGKAILGNKTLVEIFGDGVSPFNSELVLALIYSMLKNGSHGKDFTLTLDSFSASIGMTELIKLLPEVQLCFIRDLNGWSDERLEETFKSVEKNETAPTTDGAKI